MNVSKCMFAVLFVLAVVCLFVFLCCIVFVVCLRVHAMYLFTCLVMCWFAWLCVCVCLFDCLFVCLFVYLFICVVACLSVSVCLRCCLSACVIAYLFFLPKIHHRKQHPRYPHFASLILLALLGITRLLCRTLVPCKQQTKNLNLLFFSLFIEKDKQNKFKSLLPKS